MEAHWLERFLESVAEKGRELLHLGTDSGGEPAIVELCRALLSSRGEASGTALSSEVLRRYQAMSAAERQNFFEMLVDEFSPDPESIRAAADDYLASGDMQAFLKLNTVVEPPRQELFRRMNMAPGATATLVAMRAELKPLVRQQPRLAAVEADLKHLLSSWFNRGFLELKRIDWHSPAQILEKIIHSDTVQEIRGWDDLRRRLAPDRRCFAFFHPAMPNEPLVFLEVALVKGIASQAQPLLDINSPVLDPREADTAMFYSINNTQPGLLGLSFGNFLIKQVQEDLISELPNLNIFSTLSPVPGFAKTLQTAAHNKHNEFTKARLEGLLQDYQEGLVKATGIDDPCQALLNLLEVPALSKESEMLNDILARLVLAYLTLLPCDSKTFNRVAAFHLANGARLERINVFADLSAQRLQDSYGVMVNYRYDPDEIIANHEHFVERNEIQLSALLSKQYQKIAALWRNFSTAA